MTAETVTKIEELLKKATPGPWTDEATNTSVGHCHQIKPIHACVYVDNQTLPHEAMNPPSVEARSNADLICLLRNSIESLLAERKALREAVIVLHSRDAANKKLPHVLCHYCDLIYAKQALAGGES
jgi:hypothetical protein